MNDTLGAIALGKRVVACKGWRWMPGMLHGMVGGGELKSCYRVGDLTLYLDADRVPDLRDAATVGCLLALVREAHGPRCYTQACGGFWTVQNEDTEDWWGKNCVCEAEALVAALEAAP